MMQRSLEPKITGPDLDLPDVPADAWYYAVMQMSVKSGWINGYPDKTYHPDSVVNRYEAFEDRNCLRWSVYNLYKWHSLRLYWQSRLEQGEGGLVSILQWQDVACRGQ